ncbi:MAG: CHAT domain-containing protein [Phormidesmis sp.]
MSTDTSIKKILILAAGTSQERLDAEVRDIKEGLQRAQHRNRFDLQNEGAVRPRDIRRAFLDISPQIVHFSGRGTSEEGLIFEDETGQPQQVSKEAIAGLFKLFSQCVECVVLNGCSSPQQADAIAQHIPHVISISQHVSDHAAIEFAVGFYDALGAGRSIEFAYDMGCNAVEIAGVAQQFKPVLIQNPQSETVKADSSKSELEQLSKAAEESFLANSEDLYQTLLRLGYQDQISLFRRANDANSMTAFLIHGFPDYGQRWLLNRIVRQYVPYVLTGKIIKVHTSRKVLRNDVSALWREVAGRVGLKGRGKPYSPVEIAQQVSQCLKTQSILLVFHEIEDLPECTLGELISDFWLPLVGAVQAQTSQDSAQNSKFKLLMFLVDYEGCVGSRKPFSKGLSANLEPATPIKSPMLAKFSNSDLTSWMEVEYDKLPKSITEKLDDQVQSILKNTENGIPESVLSAICERCGCNWYEETEKWLSL